MSLAAEFIENALISVIIPIYKVEPYLRKCVDSVLGQTYTNLEIILVDDGSPDNCGAICNEYEAQDERVIVIHKENGGLSDARNVGIDICTGKYITFIDSDDFVAPDYVDYLLKLALDNDADMSTVMPLHVYEDETSDIACMPAETAKICIWNGKETLRHILYFNSCETSAWGKLYRRSLFDEIRYPKGYQFEDLGTTYKLCFLSELIVVSNSRKYYYLHRKESQQGAPFNLNKMGAVEMAEQLAADTLAKWPDLEKALCCCTLSVAFHIMLQIPIRGFEKEKRALWQRIKQDRRIVLFDPGTRPKARAAALLSYTGLRCTHWLGKRLLGITKC